MISLDAITVRYPGAAADTLTDVSLEVRSGEVLAIVGENGAGKSTIARVLNGTTAPDSGRVLVDGTVADASTLRSLVGFVRQDPQSQLVSSVVFDEVAFGPCNLGLSPDVVRERVVSALDACAIGGLANRGVATLSGGELQRVAIAGVLAMDPAYLVLDEATSMLDGAAREQVRDIVRELALRGVGIVMVTHDIEDLLGADRIALVEGGAIGWNGGVGELFASDELSRRACVPDGRLARALRVAAGRGVPLGPEVGELSIAAANAGCVAEMLAALSSAASRGASQATGPAGIELQGVTVRYGTLAALDGASLHVGAGRILLVAGRSGSGKSTASRVCAGLLAPDSGSVRVGGSVPEPGRVGLCLQRAEDQLFCETVLEDVAYGPANLGQPRQQAVERAREALAELGVDESLWDVSPFALSGGQRRRAALAGIRALDPAAYVLDEPTVGLDARARGLLHDMVRSIARDGVPVMVVSHDVGEWLDVADDVALLRDGVVAWQGTAFELTADPAPLERAGLVVPAWMRLRGALEQEVRDGR